MSIRQQWQIDNLERDMTALKAEMDGYRKYMDTVIEIVEEFGKLKEVIRYTVDRRKAGVTEACEAAGIDPILYNTKPGTRKTEAS